MILRVITGHQRLVLLLAVVALGAATCCLAESDQAPIEACGIEAHRLPPLVVPEHYELVVNASELAAARFSARVTIHARYTDFLPSTPRVTFMGLLRKICQTMLSRCRGQRLRRRQILLNIGKSLDIESVRVERAVASASSGSNQPSSSDQASPSSASVSYELLEVDDICADRANALMAITLTRRPARDEQLIIRIAYRGRIDTHGSPRGFYQSLNRAATASPDTDAGESSQQGASSFVQTGSANTHFFPADARTTFPCFDQPDLKATFSLRLIHPTDLVAISNMPPVALAAAADAPNNLDEQQAAEQEQRALAAQGLRVTQFQATPRMSTYLFAFAVGRFDTVACQAEGRTRPLVTAYAPPGRAQEAQFTLDAVCRAIPLAENYLKRDFPLAKLDLVSTRRMGDPARENWGMLVFTEEFLLTHERATSLVVREEIAKLAAHVVLHHWMGNLVTASWWDDQWLFDGFTLWRSHLLASELHPQFSYDFNYLLRTHSPMLDAHTSGALHPIKTHQELSADEELQLFDVNTYNKAAALYHQTNAWLGEYVLRDALTFFLEAHAYSHASQANLTRVLDSTSGLSLEGYLRSWLDQAGVPLVRVARAGRNELDLSQERLLSGPVTWQATSSSSAGEHHESSNSNGNGNKPNKERKPEVWQIPVEIQFSDSKSMLETKRVLLSEKRTRLTGPAWFRHFERGHWFKLNVNFASFYRVAYPSNVLAYLQAPIEQGLLTPADRLNIIDDLRALYTLASSSGSSSSSEAHAQLETALEWYAGERHGGVLSGLALVVDAVAARESKARAQEIALKLFGRLFEEKRFKVEEEAAISHADLNGRQDALVRLVQHEHEPALEEAVQVFEASDVHLEAFLRKPVYLAVLKRGSEAQLEELLRRLAETSSHFERTILVQWLVQYVDDNNAELKERLLATLIDNGVRPAAEAAAAA